jgi:tetratricopeptide (TPR) repeat protein
LAKPIFIRLLPKIDTDALEIFGRTFVSMGVSYWETDRREEAVHLTEIGLRQIERGVRANVIDASELAAPYRNLAKMYNDLGEREQAVKYSRLAESLNPSGERIR